VVDRFAILSDGPEDNCGSYDIDPITNRWQADASFTIDIQNLTVFLLANLASLVKQKTNMKSLNHRFST